MRTYRVLHDAQCENEMPSLQHLGGLEKSFLKEVVFKIVL